MGDAQNTGNAAKRGKPFVKGDPRINKGGRPGQLGEFRELCRSHTPEAVQALVNALSSGGTEAVAASRVLLEYGWGKPSAAPEDNDALRESGLGGALAKLQELTTREDAVAFLKGDDK